jgi:hypothetical protein
VVAAFAHTAKAFFGADELAFSLVTTAPGVAGTARNYTRFTQVVGEAIEARICHGIHFRASDVQGAGIGQNVAEWIAARYFQPRAAMPGLPATGAGNGGDHRPVGWLALAAGCALVAGGWLRRRGARRA